VATGYGGTYRGTVVDNVDPTVENRLLVVVQDVNPEPAWAKPSDPSPPGQVPGIGEDVTVVFEGGDSDYPVWQHAGAMGSYSASSAGYPGVYQASVINNVDPTQGNRLQVSVPEVLGEGPVWANPAPSAGLESSLPEVGSTVWVQFEGGDINHPTWMNGG
jgi:hypothetical protein